MDFKEKTVVVTGAARGIGKTIASKFARKGANIVICDISDEALIAAEKDLKSEGAEVLALKCNVTKVEDVEALITKALDKFGGIHILVNNAGITKDGLLMKMSESDWDAVLDINLKGAFLCTKFASKVMMKQRYGKIVNLSSVVGVMGNAGQTNYSASKGGLIAMTKSVAKELAGRNVNVNAVAPGFITTLMTDKLSDEVKQKMLDHIPLKRFGTPEEVANIVLFLASEEASYITGETIKVTGGMAM